MKKLVFLAIALTACGDPTGPGGPGVQLGPNEILVQGTIESASRLIALPISLSIPSASDPLGMNNIVVATASSTSGRYEMRAEVTPAQCAGEFAILLFDAQNRWVGKRIQGCGLHTENFNVGIGFPSA